MHEIKNEHERYNAKEKEFMDINILNDLVQKEEVIDVLMELDNVEDMRLVLEKKGYKINSEEIQQLQKTLQNKLREEQELDDDVLEKAAGGAVTLQTGLAGKIIERAFRKKENKE